MSHALEQKTDGTWSMAYAGETPWHGLGKKVPSDLTPIQMLEAAGLDWTVSKVQQYAMLDPDVEGQRKIKVFGEKSFLVRSDRKGKGSIVSEVSNDWNMIQNHEAAEFFNGFVAAGDMEMHTAGSLYNGEVVWFLAKMKETFELFKGDAIESYMLFTNPHRYAMAQSTALTTCRVVCKNTQQIAYNEASEAGEIVKHSHRLAFDADKVKEKLGVAKHKLEKYKEAAQLLCHKKAKQEDVVEFLKKALPAYQNKSGKAMSKNAELALSILETQPGAEFGAGTWWQPYNAVTFLIDHHIGKTDDSRLDNAWFGNGVKVKNKAFALAVEMAS